MPMRTSIRRKVRRFVAGTTLLGLIGGAAMGIRSCASSDSPEKPKEQETIVDMVEKAVKAVPGGEKGKEKDIAAQYVDIFREGYARHPREFQKYFTERLAQGDENLIRLINNVYDITHRALETSYHPREVFSQEKDGYTIADFREFTPTYHLVKGKGAYVSLSDGKDYLVARKKDLGSEHLDLVHESALRERVDRREPKQTLAYMAKLTTKEPMAKGK